MAPGRHGVAGLVLVVGARVALAGFFGNTADPPKETFSNEPVVDVTKPQKNIEVPLGVRKIAQRFVTTAVARKNLDDAYDIFGPQIKQA